MRTKLFGALAIMLAVSMLACGDGNTNSARGDDDRDEQQQQSSATNADRDTSTAPGEEQDVEAEGKQPLTATAQLRSRQVRTRHVIDGAITAGKLGFVAVTVNVNATATTGSSAANPDLAGGVLFGCNQAGNQDQHVDNVVLNGDGSVTVTLAAAATAQNNFRCIVMKANAKGIS